MYMYVQTTFLLLALEKMSLINQEFIGKNSTKKELNLKFHTSERKIIRYQLK